MIGILVLVLKFGFCLIMFCWILMLLYKCLIVCVLIFGNCIFRMLFFFNVIGRFFRLVIFFRLVMMVVRFLRICVKLMDRMFRKFFLLRVVVFLVVVVLRGRVVLRGLRVVIVGLIWKLMNDLGVF